MRRAVMAGIACLLPGLAVAQAGGLPAVIRPEPIQRGVQEAATVDRNGHFYFQTLVNGAPVRMLFDTGATAVALRGEDAAKFGIDPAALDYSLVTATANGRTRSAKVVIASLTIGGITRRDVLATVSRPGQLSETLLGQSFLARLPGYRQEANRLVLLGGE